jgi:protoporphyrinogen oxidase
MQCEWLGERVAAPSLRTVVRNALTKEEAGNWGPNATFRFPSRGGTGGIWTAVADLLPTSAFRLGGAGTVSSLDASNKIATMGDGRRIKYQSLISTMAVDGLLDRIEVDETKGSASGAKAGVEVMRQAAKTGLVYSSTIVLGLGIRGERPERIGDKCWLYFPEDDAPFYRATIFSNYSPHNTPSADAELPTLQRADPTLAFDAKPKTGPYWSLMLEVCQSEQKPVDLENLMRDTVKGALATQLIKPEDEIVCFYERRFDHG